MIKMVHPDEVRELDFFSRMEKHFRLNEFPDIEYSGNIFYTNFTIGGYAAHYQNIFQEGQCFVTKTG